MKGFKIECREYAKGSQYYVLHGQGYEDFKMKNGESSIWLKNDNVMIRFFDCEEIEPRVSTYACETTYDTVFSIPFKTYRDNPCKYLNNYLKMNFPNNDLVKLCYYKEKIDMCHKYAQIMAETYCTKNFSWDSIYDGEFFSCYYSN
jgi:hypothetical protein